MGSLNPAGLPCQCPAPPRPPLPRQGCRGCCSGGRARYTLSLRATDLASGKHTFNHHQTRLGRFAIGRYFGIVGDPGGLSLVACRLGHRLGTLVQRHAFYTAQVENHDVFIQLTGEDCTEFEADGQYGDLGLRAETAPQ